MSSFNAAKRGCSETWEVAILIRDNENCDEDALSLTRTQVASTVYLMLGIRVASNCILQGVEMNTRIWKPSPEEHGVGSRFGSSW